MSEELNKKLDKESLEMMDKARKDFENLMSMDSDTRTAMTAEYYKNYRETCSDFLDKVQSIQNVIPSMFHIMDIAMICVSSDRLSTLLGGQIPTTAVLGSPDNVAKLIMHILNQAPELKPLIKEQLNG